jgi:cobalt-zinc-cadmium efflux system outer membrane protein
MRHDQHDSPRVAAHPGWLVCLVCLAGVLAAGHCRAEPILEPADDRLPPVLSAEAAMVWAMQHNPDLAALRTQHGIAAAGVVIARTYPYNPILYNRTTYATGPADAGVTQHVPVQSGLFFQVELCRQGRYRVATAQATLTRTDWEIAYQELLLAVRVARAFQAVLYRQEKFNLAAEALRVNQEAVTEMARLVELGQLRRADLIVARTEVDGLRAAAATARSALAVALAELNRSLGVTCTNLTVQGNLDLPPWAGDCKALVAKALQERADLRARQVALEEAEARLRFTVADRFGNPLIGPFYEQDPTHVDYWGVQVSMPLPVCNTRRGDIEQRKAEKERAILDLHRSEVQVEQDVEAALSRLTAARASVQVYKDDILPNLQSGLESIRELFQKNEPGVDSLRVLDFRRRLLRARDAFLDVLWELSQAHADLAAAVGDPVLSVCGSSVGPLSVPAPSPVTPSTTNSKH